MTTAAALVRSVARVELQLVSASIDVVDRRILTRLGGSAEPARAVLGGLQRGIGALSERTVERGRSAPTIADSTRTAPTRTVSDGSAADAGSAVLSKEELSEAQELAESRLADEQDHLVGELAEDDELRRVQAELRAKHTLQEEDEVRATDS